MKVSEWVESNSEMLGGTPVFRGTRVPVESLFINLAHDVRLPEIIYEYSLPRDAALALLQESRNDIEEAVTPPKGWSIDSIIASPRLPLPRDEMSNNWLRDFTESPEFNRNYRMNIILWPVLNAVHYDVTQSAVVFYNSSLSVREMFNGIAGEMSLSDLLKNESERTKKSAIRLLRWSCRRVIRAALLDYFDSKPDMSADDKRVLDEHYRSLDEDAGWNIMAAWRED
jgi:uncharacterized protein (DUF433 family)